MAPAAVEAPAKYIIDSAVDVEPVENTDTLTEAEKPTKIHLDLPVQTLRDTEYQRVAALVVQANFLYEQYSQIMQGAEEPDKEWKSYLKEESHGTVTAKQAEKLINIADALLDSSVDTRQFDSAGLMEWALLPGAETRSKVLAIADSEDYDYLTAKTVKLCVAIHDIENSEFLPDNLKKELETLSGPARTKVRKVAKTYIDSVSKIGSPEIEEALKVSLDKRIKASDILTGLKDAVPDAKAAVELVNATGQLEDVVEVVEAALREDCVTETAKLVKTQVKRAVQVFELASISTDLEKALADMSQVKSESIVSLAKEIASMGSKTNFKIPLSGDQVAHVQLELFPAA